MCPEIRIADTYNLSLVYCAAFYSFSLYHISFLKSCVKLLLMYFFFFKMRVFLRLSYLRPLCITEKIDEKV